MMLRVPSGLIGQGRSVGRIGRQVDRADASGMTALHCPVTQARTQVCSTNPKLSVYLAQLLTLFKSDQITKFPGCPMSIATHTH